VVARTPCVSEQVVEGGPAKATGTGRGSSWGFVVRAATARTDRARARALTPVGTRDCYTGIAIR
jgi:hypothetical protein